MVRRFLLLSLYTAILLAILASVEAAPADIEVVITSPDEGTSITEGFLLEGAAGPAGAAERVEVTLEGYFWYNATGTDEWHYWIDSGWLAYGPNVITARAWDGEAYSPNATLKVDVDNRPEITGNGWSKNLTSIVLMGMAYDDGDHLVHVELSVDNGSWLKLPGKEEWELTIEYGDLADGPHAVRARAFDGTSYSEESEQYFEINHRPELKVQVDDRVVPGGGHLSFQGTATDYNGIVKVVYVVDQGSPVDIDTTGDFSFEIDLDQLPVGDHTLRVQAYDGEEYSMPFTYQFAVEAAPPDPDYGYVVAVVGFTATVMLVLAYLINRQNRDR